MQIFNGNNQNQNVCKAVCALALDDIFGSVDSTMQDRGTIAFSVPLEKIQSYQSQLPADHPFGAHTIQEYSYLEVIGTLVELLAYPKFANFYGGWMVADGTHFLKTHVTLKKDLPTGPTLVFIPESPVLTFSEISEA